MQSPARCLACGEHGHCPSKCKAVAIPPDGFFTGGGGGGGHSHDEDEALVFVFGFAFACSVKQSASGSLGARNDSVGGEFPPTWPTRAVAARSFPNTPSNAVV
jgi:hypothetical protein